VLGNASFADASALGVELVYDGVACAWHARHIRRSGTWRCQVALPVGETTQYKYIVRGGDQEHATWRWEPGRDRSMTVHADADKGRTKVEDRLVDTSAHRSICLGLCASAAQQQQQQPASAPSSPGPLAKMQAGEMTDGQGAAQDCAHSADASALDLMAETDRFLKEMQSQMGRAGGGGGDVQAVVRRNRLFVERCHSVLEKVSAPSPR